MAAGVLLVVQLWLLTALVMHRGREWQEVTLVGLALAGVTVIGLMRVTHQVDPYGGWLTLINYVFFGLFYVFHASVCRRREEWAGTASLWLLAGILLAAGHGLVEYLLHDPGRVSGPFRDPNHLASLLTVGTALALARLVFHQGAAWRRRLWWLLPLAVLTWVLLLTGSRGGMLAFLAVLAAAMVARRLTLLLVPLVLGAGLLTIPNPFLTYLKGMAVNDPYALERIGIWRGALEMIAAHPWGVGLGNYHLFSAVHNFPVVHAVARFGRMPRQAHNMVLQLVAEGGLPMILPLLVLLAALMVICWRFARRTRTGAGGDSVTGGAILALIGLGVQAMVSKNLGNFALCCTMLFCCAVLAGQSPKLPLPAPVRFRRLPGWALAALLAWFAVWVPYHGHRLATAAGERSAAGDPAGAATLLERAVRTVPIQSYYRARLAGLHGGQFLRTGDPEALAAAVRRYDRALALNPRETAFLAERAGLFSRLARQAGDPVLAAEAGGEALRGYGEILLLNPYDVSARLVLAGLLRDAGRPGEALAQARLAVAHEPNFLRGRQLLAELLESAGRTAEAGEQRRLAAELRARYPQPLPGWGPYETELLRPRSIPDPGVSIGKGDPEQ
jgi:O-antigen ligase